MLTKRAIFVINVLSLGAVCAMAQSESKSTSKELKEVVVEAENQIISPQSATYRPTAKQKRVARNATTLLGMMAIPQIDVDMVSGSVKTLDGQGVAIYIDNIEASSNDLEGMKTTDVKRVEFYYYPADPIYKGAKYVVNFVMQKYLYGGYTKLTAEKQFEANRSVGSVYSKMTYRKMVYDFSASDSYLTTRRNGSDIIEDFRFSDLYGEGPKDVSRISSTKGSRLRDNTSNFVVRALYSGTKARLSNRISLVLNRKPINESVSTVSYTPEIISSGYTRQSNNLRNLTAAYNGDFYFRISDRMSLQTDLRYTHGHNSSDSRYASGDEFSIKNIASETSNFVRLNPRLSYNISRNHRLTTYLTGAWSKNQIDYSGSTTSREHYNVQAYFAGTHYDFISAKIQTGADIGWGCEINKISGVKSDNSFPVLSAYANYMPARKHMLSLAFNYTKDVPDPSQKSPNMLRQDELMWFTGSADLKDYSYLMGSMNYTWLPNNKWQIAATTAYNLYNNRCVALYTPTAPEGTMLRHYVNGGEYSAAMLAVNATGRFLRNSIVVTIMPQLWVYHTSGTYRNSINDLNGRMQISYFPNNFYFSGFYSLRRKYPATHAEYVGKEPEQYQLQAGWGNGVWNVTLSAYNFFRNIWECSRQTLSSEWYDYRRIHYSSSYHRHFEISVRYTIGYGKKVDQRNEVDKGEAAKSAILK